MLSVDLAKSVDSLCGRSVDDKLTLERLHTFIWPTAEMHFLDFA